MSDTPRTDAIYEKTRDWDDAERAFSFLGDFTETLEREAAKLREALEVWMEYNSETVHENPCPDHLRRANLRLKAKALTESLLKEGGQQ